MLRLHAAEAMTVTFLQATLFDAKASPDVVCDIIPQSAKPPSLSGTQSPVSDVAVQPTPFVKLPCLITEVAFVML